MSNLVVSQVMKHILVVKIDTTLSTLMKQVNWNYYICVAVIDDDDNLFGIITRQLIGYATKKKLNFNTVRAWEICTPEMLVVEANLLLKEAVDIMIDKNVRHLIVKNGSDYVGVLRPLDILAIIDWEDPEKLVVNA